MKIMRRILLALVVLVVLAVVAALAYRAMWQRRIANGVKITSPNGIDEGKFIEINGAKEWITIRGENKDNPVILFLHGGPSEANSPFVTLYRRFEKDFVFVQWDQPGAGKTYIQAGDHQPKLTLEDMAADGIAVAEYVRGELHKSNVILIGQDWGGVLGVRMIERQPRLFAAFIGTGQIVSWLAGQDAQYEYTKSRATASHDQKTLDALSQLGPPPYRSLEGYRRFGECFQPYWPPEDAAAPNRLTDLLGIAPSLSIMDVYGWTKGLRTGEEELTLVLMQEDLRTKDRVFSAPVFFVQGGDDVIAPTSLVSEYVSNVQAPIKKLDVVPGAGHFVMWTHPAEFLNLLRDDLRSASMQGGAAD
jgi:pimeloyl-ACP methyl ester carboxylesterase